jgi:GxxExxY protein
LTNRSIPFIEEKSIDVKYKRRKIDLYHPDFIAEDKVILEIKVAPLL